MNEIKRLYIKSAGLVDGRWEVVLSDGSKLAGIQNINVKKSLDSIGTILIEIIAIDEYHKNEN